MIVTIVFIVVCIVMEGFYAGFETGSYCLNRIRLRYRVREGIGQSGLVDRLLARPAGLVSTTLVGTNLFVYLATLSLTNWLQAMDTARAELTATLILALPLFIFAEVIPKDLFRRAADSLVYVLAKSFMVSVVLFSPVTAPLGLINRLLHRLLPSRADQLHYSRARLRHFFEESHSEGVLSAYQNTMVDNIMRLREVTAEAICVRMASVITLPTDASFDQVRKLAEKFPHRRYPVRDPISAEVVGVVNVLDLLQDRGESFSVLRHVRDVAQIPGKTSVIDALRHLRSSTVPMGLVTDEKGRVIGVLTVKDLVEEIVGELGVW